MKSRTDALVLLALALAAHPAVSAPVEVAVAAVTETEGTTGDADDPAIWVNPADPAQSLILGTDKTAGLLVYGLDGRRIEFRPDGKLNNVDLRQVGLPGIAAVAAASRRDDDTILIYLVGPDGTIREASPFAHPAAPAGTSEDFNDVYGLTMGRDAADGKLYVLANYKTGQILQWQISLDGDRVSLTLVRQLRVSTQPEGMVVDDRAGHLYVGEEDRGIWRFGLSPGSGDTSVQIDAIPSACLPVDDVEGLAIYDGADGRYLVASAQGIHKAALYRLDGAAVPSCVAKVGIAAGVIDGVTETDGLDVTATPVGAGYPKGLLVMMDDQNANFTTNFKLIDWAGIRAALP